MNLLVGTNNSGKSSVLEALYILASNGDPLTLWRILNRRGERLDDDPRLRQSSMELDVSHLFHGHEIRPGSKFELTTSNESTNRIRFEVAEVSREDQPNLPQLDRESPFGPRLVLSISGNVRRRIILTRRGGLSSESLDYAGRARRINRNEIFMPQYISTESLTAEELSALWNKIVLTDAEELVLNALRFVEPRIERIAPLTSPSYYNSPPRGGFVVKLSGVDQPVPIGSLGDGTWRMLALAIALTRAKGGALLVDEIDTGLHYTVLADMWRLIFRTATDLNVQVFATTHSSDCITSLAHICAEVDESLNSVSIQRIEPGKHKSVPYNSKQIKLAAERHIEVR